MLYVMFFRRLILPFVLVNFFFKLSAQIEATTSSILIKNLGNKEGLSQGFVPAIVQDAEGYMWFATKDGLNRYDGYKIRVFRNEPDDSLSLPENEITQLAMDENHHLWVATQTKGLLVFDPIHEVFYPVATPLNVSQGIGYMYCRNEQLMTVSSQDICIYRINQVQPHQTASVSSLQLSLLFRYSSMASPPGLQLSDGWFDIRFFPDNSIWMAKKDTLQILRENKFSHLWERSILSSKNTPILHQPVFHFTILGRDSVLFIGTDQLALYSISEKRCIYLKAFNKDAITKEDFYYARPAFLNDTTALFFAKSGAYLFHSKQRTCTLLYSTNNKAYLTGLTHYADRDGTIWVGTSGHGVCYFDSRSLLFHTDTEDCYGFKEDALGEIIVHFRSGARRLNPITKERKPLIPERLMNSDWKPYPPYVWCTDPIGVNWLWTASLLHKEPILLRYDLHSQHIDSFKGVYPSSYFKDFNNVPYLFTDDHHDVWMLNIDGCKKQFIILDGRTAKEKRRIEIPWKEAFSFHGILQDKQGNIWFGSNAGLLRYNLKATSDLKAWSLYHHSENDPKSLSGDKILCITDDPQEPEKYLWIGTNGNGFNKMNKANGSCEHYNTTHGLPNNVVYSILNDEDGHLWLSTNEGISCFHIQQKTFRNYDADDGLSGNEFNSNQYLKCKNGMMFFGGVEGITWFQPKEILNHVIPDSKLVLTSIDIQGEQKQQAQESKERVIAPNATHYIHLSPNQKMVTIEFSLLQFCNEEKKKYQYQLKGFNDQWIQLGNRHSVTFTNLDPGEYTLFIKGCNSDGQWNKESRTLIIEVEAPWYKTWWFRIISVLILLSSTYAFYRYRLRQELKIQGMRNVIASDLHDELGSTISSISVYSDILKEKIEQPDLRLLAGRINSSSTDILSSLSDIVWSINPKNDRFDSILLRMQALSATFSELQGSVIHFEKEHINAELSMDMNRRKNLYLFYKEAFINAIKYAKAKNIWIRIRMEHHRFNLEIEDDGMGFDTNQRSDGNGLHNLKLRAKELQAEYHLRSTPGQGTLIQLSFPI